jgi:hypothetical protein
VRDNDGVGTVIVEHAKDFEAGAEVAFRLEPVELGLDDEGDQPCSCVVVPTGMPDAAPKLAKGAQLALNLLKELVAEGGVPLPADANVPA